MARETLNGGTMRIIAGIFLLLVACSAVAAQQGAQEDLLSASLT